MKTHDEEIETFTCDECTQLVTRKDNMFKHRERKHRLFKISFDAIKSSSSEYKCNMCDAKFGTDRKAFESHITTKVCMMKGKKISLDKEGRFQCDLCDKSFVDIKRSQAPLQNQ